MDFREFLRFICFVLFLIYEKCCAYDNLLLGRTAYDFFPPIYSGTLQAVTDGSDNNCLYTQTTPNKAYFRIDMTRSYPIQNVRIVFRSGHIHRLTPFRMFVSQTSNVEETLCYEWTDTTRLPEGIGTYPCNATGRYFHITSNRGNITLPNTWRNDEPVSSMSFCELSIEGCLEYGRFGTNCDQTCNCRMDTCDYVTGICPGGECADGWTGNTCSDRLNVTTEVNTTPTTTHRVTTNNNNNNNNNNMSTTTSSVSGITTARLNTGNPLTGSSILLSGTNTVSAVAIVAVALVTLCLFIVAGLLVIVGSSLIKHQRRKHRRKLITGSPEEKPMAKSDTMVSE